MSTILTPLPEDGQLAEVRQRRWIVTKVAASTLPPSPLEPAANGNAQHLVDLSSVEDDGLGEELQVIWEIEPGARILEKVALPEPTGFDEPRRLDAFLDAVRWGAASTADVRALQAPFRDSLPAPGEGRRLVLIAGRSGPIALPKPRYGVGSRRFRSVRDAIYHLPATETGQAYSAIPNHVAAAITPLNLERLRCTPPDGGGRRAWPDRLRLDCHSRGYDAHTDVYGRMAWDAPAPTLTGRCHSISNGRYGHPTQDRAISLREAAALQPFPDGYEFWVRTSTSRYK